MKINQSSTYDRLRKNGMFFLGFLVLVLLSSIPSMAQNNEQGIFLNNWQPKTIVNPTSTMVAQTTAGATATVNVDAANKLTKVSKYVYGHNAAIFDGKINNNVPFMNTIKELAPNVIRWPGGNISNDYFWSATNQATCPRDLPPPLEPGAASTPSKFHFNDQCYGSNNNSWTMSLNDYYDMLAKTNSTGIICVNYAYARYSTSADPVAAAAKYAADWVRYDNGRTKYWEIGNENFGSWETGYKIDKTLNKDGQPEIITGDLYGRHCVVFIDAMKAAAREIGSDIKIGVVVHESESNDPVMKTWNSGLMPHISNKADFLIPHNYFGPWKQNSNADVILASVDDVAKIKQHVLADLQSYGGKASLPLALTEWNINALGSQQQTSYINGIHGALMLGECIKNAYGQTSRWDFLNGWNNGDTHGLFADGETDIAKYSPRAPFYYMYYFQKFFGDTFIKSDVLGNTNIKSYASLFSSGQSGIVVVNKGATTQTIDLKMNNFSIGKKYHYYVLTGGQETQFSRSVFVNGKGPQQGSGGPANFSSIAPNGTDILNNSIKITLPKYSIVYVLVENGTPVVTAPEINVVQSNNSILSGTGKFDFLASVPVGASSTAVTFTVQNKGTANLNVGSISIGGNNPTQFAVTQISTSNISGPNGVGTFSVTFKPTIAGDKSAIISIVNNDSNENPYTFVVTGKTALLDCAGIINGTAKIDACGSCVGGTTGKVTLDTDGDGQPDCVDSDDDNDGITDATDCAPLNASIKGAATWYQDLDLDGKGDPAKTIASCNQPSGYVAVAGDACPSDKNKITPGICGCGVVEGTCGPKDCAGVVNGTAKIDACGKCSGGTTGVIPITDASMCGGASIGVKGPLCVEAGKSYSYTVTTDNIPVSSIGWWTTNGATMSEAIGNERLVTANIPSYASGSMTITAGVNYTAAPWYKPFSLLVKVGGCAASAVPNLKVEASPLPFDQTTTLTLENEAMISTIVVMDLSGVELYRIEKVDASSFELGKDLSAGIYVVHVYSEHGVSVKKLMKLN